MAFRGDYMKSKTVKTFLLVVGVVLVVLIGLKSAGLLDSESKMSRKNDNIYDTEQIVYDYDKNITFTFAGTYDKKTKQYSVLTYANNKSGNNGVFYSLDPARDVKSYGTLISERNEDELYPTLNENLPINFASDEYTKDKSMQKSILVESDDITEVILCNKTYKPKKIILNEKNGKAHNYSVFFIEYELDAFDNSDYEIIYDLVDKTGKKCTVHM